MPMDHFGALSKQRRYDRGARDVALALAVILALAACGAESDRAQED